ncbi:uncharacterized protein LOC141660472 [Apium graveolens]|uniref:uncharacterized protein LOC141660472 n=1 Tax=Apium graveolens TaxID=4045 RepID=UPI003D7AF136
MTPRLGGRLFQQYIVDAFSAIEQTRLWCFRINQTILRNELYSHICDYVRKGDASTSNVGKCVILPARFVGSKRYMQQNFQDALAVCRHVGHPDIFLTMTCNPLWDEIQKMMEFVPGCKTENYPDIISRVFRLKLEQLTNDTTVRYYARTMFDKSGFPLYKHRRQNITINIRNAELDNQWVVPYNRDLLVKYQCHINIEICSHARSLKYLFKYSLKDHDTATVQVTRKKHRRSAENNEECVDEIQAYFDKRYICGAESAYRIFGFPIHHRTFFVERLPFHLPGEQNCTFYANEDLGKVVDREKKRLSKLEAFFLLNSVDADARQYTYDEIPQHYVWNDGERKWNRRKRGMQIGCLSYTHHSSGEVWYLHLLLTKVRGPTSF